MNKTKIKQINFYVSRGTTPLAQRKGAILFRIKGMNLGAPAAPIVISDVPERTVQPVVVVSGTKEAHAAILVNGAVVVPSNAGTTWTMTLTLGVEGNNVFRITAKNSIGKVSATAVALNIIKDPKPPVPSQPAVVAVRAGDRRLFVRERLADGTLSPEIAYVSKGVNWSPHTAGASDQNLHLEFAKWYATDLPLMAQMGINTVRVYHDFGTGTDAFKILDEMWRLGIKVIMTVDSPRQGVVADLANISTVVNAYKNHPAILMWAVGNEWDYNNYYGTFTTLQASAAFTEQAAQLIKTLDPNHSVTTVIADPHIPGIHPLSAEAFPYLSGPYTKDIVNTMVPSMDVWGINLYRGNSFQDATAQWSSISNKPVYIGESGADPYDHRINAENQAMQSQMDAQLWDETYFDLSAERTNGTVIGSLGFEWNDEWWKNGDSSKRNVTSETNGGQPDGYNDEEWFGMVDINRNLKQIYSVMKNRFTQGQSAVQLNATPLVTVTSQGSNGTLFKIDDKAVLLREGGQYGGRGMTVAVIDPNTGIRLSESRTFDTWFTSYGTGTFANTQAFINYVNSFPNGTILAIAIEDEGGFVTPGGIPWSNPIVEQAYQLLESLGSAQIRQVKYQGGWAMITIKGQGKLAEAYSAPSTPVTIQSRLSLTLNPDAGRRSPLLGASSALASSVPVTADLFQTIQGLAEIRFGKDSLFDSTRDSDFKVMTSGLKYDSAAASGKTPKSMSFQDYFVSVMQIPGVPYPGAAISMNQGEAAALNSAITSSKPLLLSDYGTKSHQNITHALPVAKSSQLAVRTSVLASPSRAVRSLLHPKALAPQELKKEESSGLIHKLMLGISPKISSNQVAVSISRKKGLFSR